jgi:hypothetical protein
MKHDHELDAALRRVMAPEPREPADAGAERIMRRLASAPLPAQKRAFAWWPSVLMDWNFAPAWPRVAALAGAAVLGVSIGLSGLGTRIAADLDLVRVASADEANVFDVDSVAGLRP